MAEQQSQNREISGEDALSEAVDRNIPVEIFKTAERGLPPGRGRLLRTGEDELVVEKLQMIGSRFELHSGSAIEGYFRYESLLFRFDARVKETMVAARLNGRLLVPALKLHSPDRIVQGQRRSAFRVSTASVGEKIGVQLWTNASLGMPEPEPGSEEDEENPPVVTGELTIPEKDPTHTGRVVNASDMGLGVLIPECTYSRFRQYQTLLVALRLPEVEHPLVFRSSVRHTMPVREIDARIGLQLIDDESRAFARQVRILSRFIAKVQREQLG